MYRRKMYQNIDNIVQGIMIITENQCSLSEQDKIILYEALEKLQSLKKKKGKTNKQLLEEIAQIIGLLTNFFVKKSELNDDKMLD